MPAKKSPLVPTIEKAIAAAWLGRREWAGGQPAVAPTLGIILIKSKQTNRVVDMNRGWQIVKNVKIYIYIYIYFEFDFFSYVSNHIS